MRVLKLQLPNKNDLKLKQTRAILKQKLSSLQYQKPNKNK